MLARSFFKVGWSAKLIWRQRPQLFCVFLWAPQLRGPIHRSSAAKKRNGAPQGCFSVEADGHLVSFHDHGNLLLAS